MITSTNKAHEAQNSSIGNGLCAKLDNYIDTISVQS